MKFKDLPAGTAFFDVDGIAVAWPPAPEGLVAFDDGKGLDVESRPYPSHAKVRNEGASLTHDEFSRWLETGKNRFML